MKEQNEKDLRAAKEVRPLANGVLNNVDEGKTTLNEVKSLSEEELDDINGGLGGLHWFKPKFYKCSCGAGFDLQEELDAHKTSTHHE